MTDEIRAFVEQTEEVCKAATEGPWEQSDIFGVPCVFIRARYPLNQFIAPFNVKMSDEISDLPWDDIRFMAKSRTALPRALEIIKEQAANWETAYKCHEELKSNHAVLVHRIEEFARENARLTAQLAAVQAEKDAIAKQLEEADDVISDVVNALNCDIACINKVKGCIDDNKLCKGFEWRKKQDHAPSGAEGEAK